MKKLDNVINSVRMLFLNRKLIFELAKKDFRVTYAGSYLGVIWGFLQPSVTILVLWFVFQVGFKSAPVKDVPFILWLLCGMVPWLFISESISKASNSLIEYNYLVKKVVFRISSLPLVKVLSSLFVHVFFIFVLFFMFALYKFDFSIYYIQVLYYLFATLALVISISLITASLVPFFKDMNQIIGIILQILFWLTPIFWDINIIPDKYSNILKFNLVYYIISGYRETFIEHIWFWDRWKFSAYFWIMIMILLFLGIRLFNNLKSHFADVI